MESKLIYGIQQIGVGVDNADKAFEWYATRFGSDVPVFEDNNVATDMAQYMGGVPHSKRAILAMNMQGGGGYEFWQYLDREPVKPLNEMKIGDLGINAAFIKTKNLETTYNRLKSLNEEIITEISTEPDTIKSFYIKDPYGNILKVKESNSWYDSNGYDTGGVLGCSIGVTDIDKALKLYKDILEYDQVVYDKTGYFEDLQGLPDGDKKFRRILLTHKPNRVGGFSKLLGDSQIELIQSLETIPVKIFGERYWGDIGFIHLCFDVKNLKSITKECEEEGFEFKVLSSDSFDMGDANGHWGYIEDPDGTLIEFVETHKVTLVKKLGLNINLRKRNPKKPLPNWLIKGMNFNKVKKFNYY